MDARLDCDGVTLLGTERVFRGHLRAGPAFPTDIGGYSVVQNVQVVRSALDSHHHKLSLNSANENLKMSHTPFFLIICLTNLDAI